MGLYEYLTLLDLTLLYFSWRWWWWGVLTSKKRLFTYILFVLLSFSLPLFLSPSLLQLQNIQNSPTSKVPNLLITNKAICPVRGNFSTSLSSQLNIIISSQNSTLPTWTKSEVGSPPSWWTRLKHHTQFHDRPSSTSNCFLQHAAVRFRQPVSPFKSIAQSYDAMLIQSKKKKALSAE